MTQTYLPTDALNAGIEAMFPSASIARVATATNGATTLTFALSDVTNILVGMTVTGAGITSGGLVTAVNAATGVITISGTITTLTASTYTFTLVLDGSLHTASPGYTGANEVTGGTYARQSITNGAPATGVKTTTNAQNWTGMPAVTVTHFGAFSATSSGTWRGGAPLSSSLTVPAGATVAAAIGALTFTQGG
jgi:hypothetical protein